MSVDSLSVDTLRLDTLRLDGRSIHVTFYWRINGVTLRPGLDDERHRRGA